MFRIGEFSKLTQVTIRMLRYYDKMGLLKSAQLDPWTGYRMYSADQIPILNKIIYLRDSGFSVAEIAAALDSGDDSVIIEQLSRKQLEIQAAIQEEQEKLKKIELAKKEILFEKTEMHYHVSIKSIPSYQVLSYRKILPSYYAEGGMWQEMAAFAAQNHIETSQDTFSIYHDSDYREEQVDVELCVTVEKSGENRGAFVFRNTEPVPVMACTMVYGSFSNIAGAYLGLAKWLQKNSRYQMAGQSRQIVHRGPWNEENEENYLVEIQIPLLNSSDNYRKVEEITREAFDAVELK